MTTSGGTAAVKLTWPEILLPYLGRDDLWGATPSTGWRSASGGTGSCISVLMCPDDTGWASSITTTTTCSPLSYVVNYTKNASGSNIYAFGNRAAVPPDPDCTSSQVTAPR